MMKALVDLNFKLIEKWDLAENFKQESGSSWSALAKEDSDSWVKDTLKEARAGVAGTVGRQLEKSKGKY